MGILDINDNFTNKINNNFEAANLDQYINGVKEHEQPLVVVCTKVTFAHQGHKAVSSTPHNIIRPLGQWEQFL